MGVIRVLPETIANKIAAGEVIERPASIVKELVENSLDAGARSIEISIRNGGKSLIRVADDGCGMSPEDAELAFQRHATSKITSADDLERIASYGFRGEALPSIAAVSRTKIQTRTIDSATGVEITIEGGKTQEVKEAACRKGSVIEVRDLFFNTPARRKFLKSDTTEAGHILDMVSNLAFPRLDVHFVLKSADKVVLDLLPGQSLRDRAAAIFGEDIAKHFLDVSAQTGALRVEGLIGKPSLARSNRTGQLFYINKRWVRSFSLGHGVLAGYHGLLMHGQFPMSVIFLEVDLARVDVNVHPTKQEVRISNEAEIKSFLRDAVTQRLASEGDLAPEIRVPATPFAPPTAAAAQTRPFAGFSKFPFKPEPRDENLGFSEPGESYAVHAPARLEQPVLIKNKLQITKVLGQIHNTFIIAETEEGYMMIDQHAAHERVMFEIFMKNFREGNPSRQRLLMEEILEVPDRQRELLTDSIEMLGKIGFEIEPFGEKSFLIRAVPSVLEGEHAAPLIKAFLEEKEEGKIKTGIDALEENVAALIACKRRSVKAFEPLGAAALKSLLERLGVCENPFACPHGRPTFFKQSFLELERQFKRK